MNRVSNIKKVKRKRRMITRADRMKIFRRYGGVCYLCGRLLDRNNFQIDHIVPFSKGGPCNMSNYAPVHPICNRRKSNAFEYKRSYYK